MDKSTDINTPETARTIELSQNLETMLISAVRYALGRRTYIVGMTVDYITPLLPRLTDWCMCIMTRDVQEQFDMADRSGYMDLLGDACDIEYWRRFLSALREETCRRGKD